MGGRAKARPRLGGESGRRRSDGESRCEKYISDAEARDISDSQMRKVRLILGELERNFGSVAIRSVKVEGLRKIREAWKVAPVTIQKRLEMLRSFFRFCVDSGWIDRNRQRSCGFR